MSIISFTKLLKNTRLVIQSLTAKPKKACCLVWPLLDKPNSKLSLLRNQVVEVVELCGIEPQTSWMQTRRSPS